MYSPICLFTYNRLLETQQTLEALQKNYLASKSDLFIFSDGPKDSNDTQKVNDVRKYIKTIASFKSVTIYESPTNKGLANSIILGVTQIIEQYGKVIVLEDDLITSPNFLDFMNQSLDYYEGKKIIKSINGYGFKIKDHSFYDVHYQTRTYSWGWATWVDRWNKSIFTKSYIKNNLLAAILKDYNLKCGQDASKMLLRSLNNQNDSWYATWLFSHFLEKKLSVYPFVSKVNNIGFSESGTHCKSINTNVISFDKGTIRKFNFNPDIVESMSIKSDFLKYFNKKHKLVYRIKLIFIKGGISLLYNEIKSKLSS